MGRLISALVSKGDVNDMLYEDGEGILNRTKPLIEGDMNSLEAGLAWKLREGIPKKPCGGRRAYISPPMAITGDAI